MRNNPYTQHLKILKLTVFLSFAFMCSYSQTHRTHPKVEGVSNLDDKSYTIYSTRHSLTMKDSLHLTSPQFLQIKTLNDQFFKSMADINTSNADRMTKYQQVEELRKKNENALKKLLSKEQYDKYYKAPVRRKNPDEKQVIRKGNRPPVLKPGNRPDSLSIHPNE